MLNKIFLSVLFGILSLGIIGLSDAYAANANLYVSAENPQFDNYMSGPQVIEVVVIDSNLNDTDEAYGEPDVTVNGKELRMIQAVDGNWYGYFADRDMAQIADSTTTITGVGLDFGSFCSNTLTIGSGSVDFSDTVGVALGETIGNGLEIGSSSGGAITATCGTDISGSLINNINVVRESKAMNPGQIPIPPEHPLVLPGQIGADVDLWPFIQLYNLNPTGNVVVQYHTGGGTQSAILTFDTVDHFADINLDRTVYPLSEQVFVTITDLWLNIDPTDEDSWTFQANSDNPATMYQMFDEHGDVQGDAVVGGAINIQPIADDLMCEDNCVLLFDPDQQGLGVDIVTIQDNEDTQISLSGDSESASSAHTSQIPFGTYPITITETRSNSGVFVTYDEADISTLRITNTASAGSSATIDYNETPNTILVGHPPPPPVSESTFFKLVGAVSHSQNLYGAYDIDVINDFAYVPAISSNRLSVFSR